MSFAKALVVVLVLHVVAVGGIYTFNSLKTHKIAPADSAPAHPDSTPEPVVNKIVADDSKPAVAPSATQQVKIVPKVVPKPVVEPSASARPTPRTSPAAELAKGLGTSYTVVKGDNLLTIAKKFHVKYDDLLKLNKIEDPKKLQIGQKLRIPAKTKPQTQTQ